MSCCCRVLLSKRHLQCKAELSHNLTEQSTLTMVSSNRCTMGACCGPRWLQGLDTCNFPSCKLQQVSMGRSVALKTRLHAHYQVYADLSYSIKHQVFVHAFIYFARRNIQFVDCICWLVGWFVFTVWMTIAQKNEMRLLFPNFSFKRALPNLKYSFIFIFFFFYLILVSRVTTTLLENNVAEE